MDESDLQFEFSPIYALHYKVWNSMFRSRFVQLLLGSILAVNDSLKRIIVHSLIHQLWNPESGHWVWSLFESKFVVG